MGGGSTASVQERRDLHDSLKSLGMSEYEARAYVSLLALGVTDAKSLCSHSGVPSSKIYAITEKFGLLGLLEVQQSRPAKFRALEPSVGVARLMKNKQKELALLGEALPLLQSELGEIYDGSRGSQRQGEDSSSKTFFNLEFGMKNHIQKHLPHLADARAEILSYFEPTCLSGARVYGQNVKQKIVQNITAGNVSARIIFGVSSSTRGGIGETGKLVESFVRGLPESAKIQVRHTKQIHAPFHVIDGRSVVMVVDNPLFWEGRVASIYAVDSNLARELRKGYQLLWDSAQEL